ncbi:Hsp20/alpha crystallin family protein [Devosia sp. ZB163]|uniref:Hsp20/alpha crystallin family protein n=1 Tax=Devosia sp. ZB163 TaxID=3025938 RepID=UPI002361EAF4|nr:Hsp20/alpha crystallin family protein [Devosia sp. ZB163]MDC9822659.1 Hsp20/alpha crystallin family protein [Devosia sp. ZB163]
MGIFDVVPFRQRRANVPAPTDRDSDSDPILALQADMDRAFGSFWNLMPFSQPQAVLRAFSGVEQPDFKVDVRDKGNEVEIVAELPGFSEDDIEVTVGTGSVSIRAERQQARQESSGTAVMIERSVGVLERTIPLPEGSVPDQAAARFKNGALTIVVPKSVESRSGQKRIKIQAS